MKTRTRRRQEHSISGRIRALLKKEDRPINTAEIADRFGLGAAYASAVLCQLRKRGEILKVTNGRNLKSSEWKALATTETKQCCVQNSGTV